MPCGAERGNRFFSASVEKKGLSGSSFSTEREYEERERVKPRMGKSIRTMNPVLAANAVRRRARELIF